VVTWLLSPLLSTALQLLESDDTDVAVTVGGLLELLLLLVFLSALDEAGEDTGFFEKKLKSVPCFFVELSAVFLADPTIVTKRSQTNTKLEDKEFILSVQV
jgi:hypothetical protein